MGRAQIISDDGEGLYTIEVRHDTTAADAKLSKLNSILSKVDAKIAEENGKPAPDPDVIGTLEIRKTALEKSIERVTEARDADFQTQAWCADRTEGLSGEVGTIEPGTEYKNGVNVRPGYDDAAAFDAARDGQATPFLTMGVADTMVNFALMPAIQKWKPTYRYATISNIDTGAHTCRVVLDSLQSSIQGLDINYQAAFDNVPIDYMSCNAVAFEDGDAVIVKFDSNDVSGQPRVIGFKDHPKRCSFILKLNSINGVAFPAGPNSYELRLTQPIPQTITHWKKGNYTEDFTVIGSGSLDNAGVAEIEIEAGVSMDPDYPLHVGIKNHTKWGYWTTDWRGSVPDRGFKWGATPEPDGWETYPSADLGSYDFLLDLVQWFRTDIDLRTEDQTQFQNGAGETVTGYEIDVTGIKVLRRDHLTYFVTDMICDRGGETDPPINLADALDDVFPINFLDHDYDLHDQVPRNFHSSEWNATFYALMTPWQCHLTAETMQCLGGDYGQAFAYYYPQNPGAESSMVGTQGDPGILTDRSGRNHTYTISKAEIDVEQDYTCTWIWSDTLGGYVLTNWITGETEWQSDACQPGEGVMTSSWDKTFVSCGRASAEVGEGMIYEMIDLSVNEI